MDARPPPHAPVVTTYRLRNRSDATLKFDEFNGILLGRDSSFQEYKTRWFEVEIYLDVNGEFVVYTVGRTLVPDETSRYRIARTRSAYKVVELLTVVNNGKMYIPRQSSRALSEAAQFNDDIRDAYVNRAVT